MHPASLTFWRPWAWPWPMPAVVGWLLAWAVFAALRPAAGIGSAAGAAIAVGAASAWPLRTVWRRAWVALGFPVSALTAGWASGVPAWAWLLPLAALAGAYPLRAWRDAPFFPTPAGALDALSAALTLPAGARVLDAGCGLGHGLRALRRAWPQARVEGIEFSRVLAVGARLACPWAIVWQGDMWARSWRDVDLVYLFQRPESMARSWVKATAEMAPGTWLVSLEFVVPGREPDLTVRGAGRAVHAWRVPSPPAPTLNTAGSGPITRGNAWAPAPRA